MTAIMIATACIVLSAAMAGVWVASVRLRNAGIVDVAWAALFTPTALIFAVPSFGDPLRRGVAFAMMALWSLRLAWHLGRRVLGHLEVEDGRYARLRESWGESADRKMFWFFQFQAVTIVLFSLPILLIARNPAPRFSAIELAGIALWLVALAGETLADAQLRRFKADPANRGGVCDVGLWRYSRHPNYFFESLIWWGWFLFALGSPHGWWALYCPLLMLWFLYKVTGIPATEEHSLRSRGEAYRRYQQTTSPFVPWFRRRAAGGE